MLPLAYQSLRHDIVAITLSGLVHMVRVSVTTSLEVLVASVYDVSKDRRLYIDS